MVIFSENPRILGIGIDENTAIEVVPGESFEVGGDGAVFVVDGTVTHTNAPDVADDEVIAMTDSLLHVLPAGYCFDLKTKRPIVADGKVVAKRSVG